MGSLSLVEAPEVLEPDQRSLAELASDANHEHAEVIRSGGVMLEHAIRAGEALAGSRMNLSAGTWAEWLAENFSGSYGTAFRYMRIAAYQEQIREHLGTTNLTTAYQFVDALPRLPRQIDQPNRLPDDLRVEALRLHRAGKSHREIAELLEVSISTATEWVDPSKRARRVELQKKYRAERKVIREAEQAREREQAVKRAVRKAGAAGQELYAMCERMQDVLAQAHREATDPEARRHYALMGEHYRKMRDEGILALGVS